MFFFFLCVAFSFIFLNTHKNIRSSNGDSTLLGPRRNVRSASSVVVSCDLCLCVFLVCVLFYAFLKI